MNRIITIGREFGSGGRELGRRLAERLGWAYYDNEIITEIAKKTELSENYVRNIVERRPMLQYPIHVGSTFYGVQNTQLEQGAWIFREQCNILKEMAEKSNCVIVGRCADYILRDYDPFRIFVYADIEKKIARCKQKGSPEEDYTNAQLRKKIKSVDKNRAQYYNFYTGKKWGDKLNYDICINTGDSDLKVIVEDLALMIEKK